MALLFLPVQATRAEADETKQTDAVCRVVVVALVLTKNILGLLTTTSSVDLNGENMKWRTQRKDLNFKWKWIKGMKLTLPQQREKTGEWFLSSLCRCLNTE